jgi:eukaryotic-like serine/threonine-protein kinase
MGRIRRIIHEVHRRSIWQVLAVYLAGSWVALQVVDALTRTAGLPDWVPPFAIVLLVIGLPIVLGTAIVQEGAPLGSSSGAAGGVTGGQDAAAPSAPANQPAPSGPTVASTSDPGAAQAFLQKHLTWKRAILGGVAACVLLGSAVGAYFAMRASGVGPVASLVAQGVLDEREPILLADFENSTDDAALGGMVTELLRVDLTQSQVVSLVEAARLEDALRRAGRDPGTPVTPELARELAVRDGIKAFIEGEVGSVGGAYVLTATLRRGEDGASLASFRRTARDPDAFIDAIDRLSQDIRERVGESLRSIRRGTPLAQATTSSLEALRRYTEAEEELRRGNEIAGLALLREATAVDSAFAVAYRREQAVLSNLRIEHDRQVEAVERAYRHRARLTEKERYLAEAAYHNTVTGDRDAVVRAYEAVLRIAPEDIPALNNLANDHQQRGNLTRAEELYRRAVAAPMSSPAPHLNLVRNQLQQGDVAGARAASEAFLEAFPDDPTAIEAAALVDAWSGDLRGAAERLEALLDRPDLAGTRRADAHAFLGWLAAGRGRTEEARSHIEEAVREGARVSPVLTAFYRAVSVNMELKTTGDRARVLAILRGIRESEEMAELPPQVPTHGIGVHGLLSVGSIEEAREWLRVWTEMTPPGESTRAVRAEQALLEAWASNPGEPEVILGALETYRREARCGRCYEDVRPALLQAAGRLEEARDGWSGLAETVLGAWGLSVYARAHYLERLAALSEELGDAEAAARSYRHFIELWADADPELQPRVQAARERLAALEGRGG